MTWSSDSQNTVARYIAEGKRDGRFKDCTHLQVNKGGKRRFNVGCSQQSLEWTERGRGYDSTRTDPRCPADCLLFAPKESEAAHGDEPRPQTQKAGAPGPIPGKESRARIFVSHSSRDETLARLLATLLRLALNLRAEDIRCTSVDGHRLPGGADADDQLRGEVLAADVVIGIITTESLDSLYVACELGARWGADRPLIPLMAPGFSPAGAISDALARAGGRPAGAPSVEGPSST